MKNILLFAQADGGSGLVAIAIFIGVCLVCASMSKPKKNKGYTIEGRSRTTITPNK